LHFLKGILNSKKDIKLIVIDPMGKFVPFEGKKSEYAEAIEALSPLHELASDYRCSILLIHHLRKDVSSNDPFDGILGTVGIQGVFDSLLVLKSDSLAGDVLYGTGRDMDDFELSVKFDKDKCLWTINGSAEVAKLSEQRRKVLEILRLSEVAMTPKELSEADENLKHGSLRVILPEMARSGLLLHSGDGKYQLPDENKYLISNTD
jgi:hypothetical protein